jgi:hypothetical protein
MEREELAQMVLLKVGVIADTLVVLELLDAWLR